MKRAHSPSRRCHHQGVPKKPMMATHRSTRRSTAAATLNSVLSVPDLFGQIVANLHWKDALVLASVNSKYHKACQGHYNTILQPVLEELESLCGSNIHFYCGKVYAPESVRVCTCSADGMEANHRPQNQALAKFDPRYEKTYHSLPIQDKCKKMTSFLTALVNSMRPLLKFDDPANPCNMPDTIGNLGGAMLAVGIPPILLMLYPRRTALAINIIFCAFAQGVMKDGHYNYYNQAPLGEGGINTSGSANGNTVLEMLREMLPFSNGKIAEFIQRVIPSARTFDLLGHALVSRVILCAPLLDWIDDNGEMVLPPGLETFDDWDLMDDDSDFYW